MKASTVAFLGLLSPVSAMLLDFLLLNKSLTAVQMGGAALIFGSIVISQLAGKEIGAVIKPGGSKWIK